jgi:hypothetical protein
MASGRKPEEIRKSIEANRLALGVSVEKLRGEVAEITDWRKQISQHRRETVIGGVLAGFLLGGGFAGRRRRKSS